MKNTEIVLLALCATVGFITGIVSEYNDLGPTVIVYCAGMSIAAAITLYLSHLIAKKLDKKTKV